MPRCCGRISCWPQAGALLASVYAHPSPCTAPAPPGPHCLALASPSPALWSPSGVLLNAAPSSSPPLTHIYIYL